jgi:hypothetical protein
MGKPRLKAGLLRKEKTEIERLLTSLVSYRAVSDRVKLAREIAARTKPRVIDTNPKPKTLEERLALAREIAARTPPRFITIPRERGGGKIHYTEEQLTVMRGGLTAEQYRWKTIRKSRRK